MQNLSTWQTGSTAIVSEAVVEILNANLKWQQSAFDIKKNQIQTGLDAVQTNAKATESSVKKEAQSMRDQAYGLMGSGVASIAAVGGGFYKAKSLKESEMGSTLADHDTCVDLRKACQSAKPAPQILADPAENNGAAGGLSLNDGLSSDARSILEPGSYANPHVQNMSEAQYKAAFEEMDQPTQDRFMERSVSEEHALSYRRDRIEQSFNSRLNMATQVGQTLGSLSQASGQALSAKEKTEQAKQDYVKILAQYISQASSVIEQGLTTQANNAIQQKQAALDMEAQIAQAQSAAVSA